MSAATSKAIVLLALIVAPCVALAVVFGGTNLGFGDYPKHSCSKPNKPYKPYQFTDQWQLDRYNAEVRSYNRDLEVFLSCIDEYLDNSKNDIKRIQEKAQEALNDAKS